MLIVAVIWLAILVRKRNRERRRPRSGIHITNRKRVRSSRCNRKRNCSLTRNINRSPASNTHSDRYGARTSTLTSTSHRMGIGNTVGAICTRTRIGTHRTSTRIGTRRTSTSTSTFQERPSSAGQPMP